MILPHLSPFSHLTRISSYCHCGCLLLFRHLYSSHSHVCNLEGLIFNATELLTENFEPQSFQQAANNKIHVPDLAYVLLRTDHIYLYCYATTLHIVTVTAGAFIVLWNELSYSQLIAVCDISITSQLLPSHSCLKSFGHHDFASALDTNCNCLATNWPDRITVSAGSVVTTLYTM